MLPDKFLKSHVTKNVWNKIHGLNSTSHFDKIAFFLGSSIVAE